MPAVTISDPVAPADACAGDQIRLCLGIDRDRLRGLIDDLPRHDAAIYWTDFLLSITVGYGALALLPVNTPLSPSGVALYCVSVLACYRAVIFTHELAHQPQARFRAFRLAWQVLCGTAMLVPAYFYDEHRVHHAPRSYGTSNDGEYFAYARLPLLQTLLPLAISPLVPVALVFRFLVLTPLLLVSPWIRELVCRHASSLVIDIAYRRPIPRGKMPRPWVCQELACFFWCIGILLCVACGLIGFGRIIEAEAIMTGVFAVNAVRTLVAHKYAGERRMMTLSEQVLDSNDFPGLLGVLWAPVGLRFHAMHHLLPQLPYHALALAHRRVMAAIPPDSPFHTCQHRSMLAGIRAAIAMRGRYS